MSSSARFGRLIAGAIPASLALIVALQNPAAGSTSQLGDILRKLASNPTAPSEYTAAVQLRMHLRVFPWITRTVSGSEFYKHPGLYRLVFRDAPKALDQLQALENDLADPLAWPKTNDVSLIVPAAPGVDPVVRLTPKAHRQVRTLDVTVDAAKAHIVKAVWTRFDGGTITMTQKFSSIASREVVTEQDAAVRIPSMSADVTAIYSNFSLDSGTH